MAIVTALKSINGICFIFWLNIKDWVHLIALNGWPNDFK